MQIMAIKEKFKEAAQGVESLQVACRLFKDAVPETNSKHLLLIKKDFKRTTRTQKAGMTKQKCESSC